MNNNIDQLIKEALPLIKIRLVNGCFIYSFITFEEAKDFKESDAVWSVSYGVDLLSETERSIFNNKLLVAWGSLFNSEKNHGKR